MQREENDKARGDFPSTFSSRGEGVEDEEEEEELEGEESDGESIEFLESVKPPDGSPSSRMLTLRFLFSSPSSLWKEKRRGAEMVGLTRKLILCLSWRLDSELARRETRGPQGKSFSSSSSSKDWKREVSSTFSFFKQRFFAFPAFLLFFPFSFCCLRSFFVTFSFPFPFSSSFPW